MNVSAVPHHTANTLPTVQVAGLPFVACTVPDLAHHIVAQASGGAGGWVVTPNTDILRRWHKDAGFRELVKTATIFTADGRPIVWASHLQGTPLPARLTGSDLFIDLYRRAADQGLRIALIGGNPGTADAAVSRLAEQFNLNQAVARTHCPPMGFEHNPNELAAIDTLLQQWQPDIVFVGLGSPKQEHLIGRLRPLVPSAWYLGVGVSFSFVAGEVQRAPPWAQRLGLEWAHRLVQEPDRLARRYLVDGMPFAAGMLARAIMRRVFGAKL